MEVRRGITAFGLALALLLPVPQAQATLGERADSIAKDSKALSTATCKTVQRDRYAMQEMTSETTAVREFLTPEGVVFAVAWNGLVHPDLSQLLGSYDQEYRTALSKQQRKRGHRQTQVRANRVVVETWGHMRNLQGRAYLPGLVPQGVNLDEIH
ncbi:hypothetical protein GEOBRER4_n1999 [Citrifermentans bremense]|uniref:DUF2844 domain-containing protein n=1 Tax=Citrifermentans bremense TaxID=60035 RepID=A0A6S6LYP6_9BACT|nr:DUF2844 domain-containing protein [Citrifermentans bremense]BCG47172.1 hypothetical protein GEOBRER4_n1999 [Citrifermentans bremense]